MSVFSGIIERVFFKQADSGFVIFSLNSGAKTRSVKGYGAGLTEGDFVECTGDWEMYKGQETLKAAQIKLKMPMTEAGMISYLSSGKIRGIGTKTAEKLVKHLGLNIISVVANTPEMIKKVPGIGKLKAGIIVKALQNFLENQGVEIFLEQFDLSQAQKAKIKQKYGTQVMKLLEANPYRVASEISGMGFKVADNIALKLGIEEHDIRRIVSGLGYSLDQMIFQRGDTIVAIVEWQKHTTALLFTKNSVEGKKSIVEAIALLRKSHAVAFKIINDIEYASPMLISEAEKNIASDIIRIRNAAPKIICQERTIQNCQKRLDIKLAIGQSAALKTAIESGVSVITGGPGTGKTTILRALLDVLKAETGLKDSDILLCSPTGKAAQRMEESCGIEAMTIHRALKFNPETANFDFSRDNKMHFKLIVVDEGSMMDTLITDWLLQAILSGAKLIIVGDVDQLPSVGPGQVLHDLIASNVISVAKLTEIFRQAANSKIVVNAHRINQGKMPIIDHSAENNDFWFIEKDNDEDISNEIVSLIGRISKHYNVDKKDDIQVLTPMRKGLVGQYELNDKIQEEINPPGDHSFKTKQDDQEIRYSSGDKIIQVKNNNEIGIYNGTIGLVNKVKVKKDGLDLIFGSSFHSYSLVDIGDIRLAYAMTIHKSQGSEYPVVLMPMTTSHLHMLNRNLLYTGITRAKRIVILIGNVKALQMSVKNIFKHDRKTGLKEELIARNR